MIRRTKIIATTGPACSSLSMLKKLVLAGVDVFRLNFSHGTHTEHIHTIRTLRELSKKFHRPIGILADLPGPKFRTGLLKNRVFVILKEGNRCTLTTRNILGTETMIPITYRRLPQIMKKGDRILLADGLLELRVLETQHTEVVCRVLVGGELREQQGINLPGKALSIAALTPQDQEVCRLLTREPVDFVALSFVQRAIDVIKTRKFFAQRGAFFPIFAKIEKPQAVECISDIVDVSDGILIARGDLGAEISPAKVPVVQKQLIHLAFEKLLPVITATQMLDSMMGRPSPTRAEATDVANAIWDGSDAVMLSGETAKGNYPLEAVTMMVKIIEQAEKNPMFSCTTRPQVEPNDARLVLQAAASVCRTNLHRAIVAYTETGATAIALSKLRPIIPILAVTPHPTTYQKLSLAWGVRSFVCRRGRSVDEMIHFGDEVLMKKSGLKKNDRVVVVAGTRLSTGATNLMKIHQIGTTMMGKQQPQSWARSS